MSALITTPYTSWVIFPARDGFQESAAFFYGAQWNRTHELPIGAQFGKVFSPSEFVHPTQAEWSYTRFKVKLCKFRDGEPPERGYAVVTNRPLTAEEVTFFEGEWRRLREEMERGQEPVSLELA